MRRPPSRDLSYAFGPGPLSPAIKALIIANVAMFLVMPFVPSVARYFTLVPVEVVHGRVWQLVTYMFLHGSLAHIFFNMLALWMFGTELERRWGTPFFVRYYFATGIAAGLSTVVFSMVPLAMTARLYITGTIGASGAIYGLLLAYGLTFPNRPLLLFLLFPVPAKYAVMIFGAIELFLSANDIGGGVAHITHLGGLAAGYALLRGRSFRPMEEARYRYLRWKMERARKKFGVYSGGRKDDWDKHIH
jgi:membrane associated rhomboid family serine protease